jgi:hypothetical protein
MSSVEQILKNNKSGLYYNNRLILPFKAHFLKIVVANDIITDFSPASKGILIKEEKDFTDLYFHDYHNLKNVLSKYEAIKMVVVEKDEDIFDFNNHLKLAVYLKEKHKAVIEKTDEDILFIE